MSDGLYKWIEITIKYSGKCIQCGYWISEGEKALWMQNLGIKHIECPVSLESEEDHSALIIIDEEDKKLLGYKE